MSDETRRLAVFFHDGRYGEKGVYCPAYQSVARQSSGDQWDALGIALNELWTWCNHGTTNGEQIGFIEVNTDTAELVEWDLYDEFRTRRYDK